MHEKRQVLDHGYVMLVDYLGDDDSPLVAARMSTSTPTGEDVVRDARLRRRLWKDKHTSPFEMCELVVEIQCPIFVLRQLDRHRTIKHGGEVDCIDSVDEHIRSFMSRNEFSGRYSVMEDILYVPREERIRGRSAINKQGSGDMLSTEDQRQAVELIASANRAMMLAYQTLVAMGVSNEVSRIILPLSTYTRLQLKGSLLNWFKFLDLRLAPDVQEETRAFVVQIASIVRSLWPATWAVFAETMAHPEYMLDD